MKPGEGPGPGNVILTKNDKGSGVQTTLIDPQECYCPQTVYDHWKDCGTGAQTTSDHWKNCGTDPQMTSDMAPYSLQDSPQLQTTTDPWQCYGMSQQVVESSSYEITTVNIDNRLYKNH